MAQLRLYRGDSLFGELDFSDAHVEIGDRQGDTVRWDELGLPAPAGWGGRVEQHESGWAFVPRDGGDPEPMAVGERLRIGELALEIVPGGKADSLLDLARLPDDEARPMPLDAVHVEPGSAGERLRHLADLLRELEEGSTSEEVLTRALDGAFELVKAERGIAALSIDEGRGLRVVAARNFDDEDPQRALSRTVLAAVLERGKDVFTSNAPQDIPTVSVTLKEIRAICALPLRLRGRIAGVLYVDRGLMLDPFSEEDLAFLQILASLVSRRLEEDDRLRASESERKRLEGRLASRHGDDDQELAWGSPAMQKVRGEALRLLRVYEQGGLPLLITGESGTGKEVLARWLHERIEGDAGPFVAVNCAAIPHDLAESELFGIEQGVASGVMRRIGKFQQAQGGTLFLDEVGEMSPAIQTKLLRVLESRRIVRVGGREEIPIEVRIVSATNAALEDVIADGVFREDLYWRLCGVQIRMPALRERREDIPALCDVFLRRFSEGFGLDPVRLAPAAVSCLEAWHWPGNVRELRQRMGALAALSSGGTIEVADLPPEIRDPGAAPAASGASSVGASMRPLADIEMDHIRQVLDAMDGNLTRAAEVLGIHKKTLRRKLDRDAGDSSEDRSRPA